MCSISLNSIELIAFISLLIDRKPTHILKYNYVESSSTYSTFLWKVHVNVSWPEVVSWPTLQVENIYKHGPCLTVLKLNLSYAH